MKHLAIFDFDGTITTGDTFSPFIRHCNGRGRVLRIFFRNIFTILLYFLGKADNTAVKNALLTPWTAGMPYEKFTALCTRFSKDILPAFLRAEALDCIRRHREKGHRIVIVSASLRECVQPWAEAQGIHDVIATSMEIKEGILTGRVPAATNCHGANKVRMLKAALPDLATYYIYSYGDSPHDKPILDIADEAFYRRFS